MHSPKSLPILFLFLSSPSHSQTITPAPAPDLLRRQQSSSPSTSSLDLLSAVGICITAAPCTSQQTFRHVCEAEYGGGADYFHCLCTRGYYDMMSACDACSLSLGIEVSGGSAFYATRASEDGKLCSGYASEVGANATEVGAIVTEVGANATKGKGTGITSRSYPSSLIGVATRIQSVGSSVPFGGLVSTESATTTATAAGGESRGARTQGVQGCSVLSVALSMMSWGVLF